MKIFWISITLLATRIILILPLLPTNLRDHVITRFASAPRYGRKKGPPLPSTKMQLAVSSASQPYQQTKSTPPQLSSNRPVCQICGKIGHSVIDCFHNFDYSYQGRLPPQNLATMVAEANATLDHQVWYMDSGGVNAHITSNASNLTHQNSCHDSDTVTVGNGSGLQILHTSSTTFNLGKSNFHLNNILHCPQVATNLISINQFCLDNNCYFILITTDFLVKEILIGKILLQGVVDNGLYPLAGCQNSLQNLTWLSATVGVRATANTWHSRLGHPATSVFDNLFHSNKLYVTGPSNKVDFCPACQFGKAKKLPFPVSGRQSSIPLALIHSDVWVSLVQSTGGCSFYVLYVDDYSRYSWLYPSQRKSDVFVTFVQFKTIAEKFFSTSIKQIQTDNGGEFTSNQFKTFLTTQGIYHRLTCPHTSQQNGIAERKHRHIQEMGITLLAQSSLSPQYWVDAFLTSVFLINRLPSKVLLLLIFGPHVCWKIDKSRWKKFFSKPCLTCFLLFLSFSFATKIIRFS